MMTEKEAAQFKVLLGDDRSEHALAALALLEELPLAAGTDVTVFRAYSPTQATDVVLMEDALNQTCARLKQKGFTAHPELLLGVPTVKFLKHAEEQKPDLIIIGAKGLRATTGILVGGVAQQVVEYAPCPVLVVRAPYRGLRQVMFVTDGSAASQHTLEFLCQLPLPKESRLWVLHVLTPPPLPMVFMQTPLGGAPVAMIDDLQNAELQEKEEKEGQFLVDHDCRVLAAHGKPATALLKRGDAASEIIAAVREHSIDLLVTGSRGHSPIRSWMMGSVSRKLVHYSGCSALVVRQKPVS